MAWAEQRGGSWRVVFRYDNANRSFTVGEVPKADADAYVASTEELLRLLKRNVVALPDGCSIEEFLLHRGKPPATRPGKGAELTLDTLRDEYLAAHAGKLEETTLA